MALLISVLSLPAAAAAAFLVSLFVYLRSLYGLKNGITQRSKKDLAEQKHALIISAVMLVMLLLLLLCLYLRFDSSVTYQYLN